MKTIYLIVFYSIYIEKLDIAISVITEQN